MGPKKTAAGRLPLLTSNSHQLIDSISHQLDDYCMTQSINMNVPSDGDKTGAGVGSGGSRGIGGGASGKAIISANGDRPPPPPVKNSTALPAANSGVSSQPKKRRVIEDDDDDEGFPPAPMERPSPAVANPRGVASKHTAVSASSSSSSSGRGGGINGTSSSTHFSEKKKIVPGPSRGGGGGGGGGAIGTKHVSGSSAMSSKLVAKEARNRVNDDDDDDDVPVGSILKKRQMGSSSKSGSGVGGSSSGIPRKSTFSRNGVKKESSASFQIPKREGLLSSRMASPGKSGSSSSARPAGGSGSGSSSSHGKGAGSGGRYGGETNDNDFERKPNKLKRPVDPLGRKANDRDFQKEDPAKAARRKRKLEEERERLREEARKKKRRDSQGSSAVGRKSVSGSAVKAKVKPEPRQRGSAPSLGNKGHRSPRAAGGGGGDGSKKPAASRSATPRKFKETSRAEKIEQAMKVYKWWEEPAHRPGKQWDSLEHTGALFAPEYKPHGIKLKYDGKDVHLTYQQEEVATYYASVSVRFGNVAVLVGVRCWWSFAL